MALILEVLLPKFFPSKNLKEGYDQWDLKIHSQNSDASWKANPTSANNPYTQDIPRSSANDPNYPTLIQEIFNDVRFKKALAEGVIAPAPETLIGQMRETGVNWEGLYAIKRDTWYNRLMDFEKNSRMEFTTPNTFLAGLEPIFALFLQKLNHAYFADNQNHNPEFTIYKYKIHRIQQSLRCDAVQYDFIIVLTHNNSYVGATIYLEVIQMNAGHGTIYFQKYDIIGYYSTDKLFLPEGTTSPMLGLNANFQEIDPQYRIGNGKGGQENAQINYYNVIDNLINYQQYKWDNVLKNNYVCFNAEPQYYNPNGNGSQNQKPIILNYVQNKTTCESKFDPFSRRKPAGIWDRQCLSDAECPFWESNKNYPNHNGGCDTETGFCRMPVGMTNASFHHPRGEFKQDCHLPVCNPPASDADKPFCYNCRSVNPTGQWQHITKLDKCCEEQKNTKLYPFLKSPDYAFADDINTRSQA